MRYFTIRNGLLLVGLQLSMLGCVGIPDEAPQEFHSAEAALERADERDVDDYLPNTLDRAETQLEAATDLWKKSRDRDVKKEERSQLEKQATEQAAQVTTTAEQAIQLSDQVKAWDNNLQSYTQMMQERKDAMAQVKQLQDQNRDLAVASVAVAAQSREQLQQDRQQDRQQDQQQVAAKTPDISLRGPVAYFSVGSTDVDPRYAENINSLARTLSQDPNAKVTLAGFTDPRGDRQLNERLAIERAEAVAAILRDRGVSRDQIQVQAWPGTTSRHMRGKHSQAQLQLDRRVEAYITTASNSQQGQPQQR